MAHRFVKVQTLKRLSDSGDVINTRQRNDVILDVTSVSQSLDYPMIILGNSYILCDEPALPAGPCCPTSSHLC